MAGTSDNSRFVLVDENGKFIGRLDRSLRVSWRDVKMAIIYQGSEEFAAGFVHGINTILNIKLTVKFI